MLDEHEIELEEQHRLQVIQAVRDEYYRDSMARLAKYFADWRSLLPEQQVLCPEYLPKLHSLVDAVQENTIALRTIMSIYPEGTEIDEQDKKTLFAENCRSLLRQLYREWSDEGQTERDRSFRLIIDQVIAYIPTGSSILVPGAGLGRLPWELAKLGYAVEANEFSHFMLLPAQFILNSCRKQLKIFPFLFPLSNLHNHVLHAIMIPNELPLEHEGEIGDFGFVAGDFTQIYSNLEQHGRFDAVVTCFFIDTAKNILEYIQIIRNLLRPGGHWINFGPLLYHFEGVAREMSIELSREEFLLATQRVGFDVLVNSESQAVPYVQNPESMLQSLYDCSLNVFRRR